MVTVDQVRQLESKVAKAIDYINKLTDENTLLKNKLDSYQSRIDELEVLIQRFKEDQGRIEEGILSALDRLNRFEDDVYRTITPVGVSPHTGVPEKPGQPAGTVNGGEVKSYPARLSVTDLPESPGADESAGETVTAEDEAASELDIF
ncbi:MAG: cell division protein ZapB [Spirochaetaceae bacterium]|jgi:FtsZ-binding cell division protein ZapB|nr:cell division protein ZapB [Spirochaetaceae bacterium]